MINHLSILFDFIAFDATSNGILAHGPTASDAQACARFIAPTASIRVIYAFPAGRTVWEGRMNLLQAEEEICGGSVYAKRVGFRQMIKGVSGRLIHAIEVSKAAA
jgi:hypothetical protein